MLDRRAFISTISLPAAFVASGAALGAARPRPLGQRRTRELLDQISAFPGQPEIVAKDEDFWALVQQAFTADRSHVNLNNGGVSPAPRVVQEAMKRHLDYSNTTTAYTMWQVLEPQREAVRQRVARHWGVDPEEIAFTRNSSESLETCQYGLDLQRGDEVLTTTLDYPRMITTFKQRERREGIVLKQFKLPIPCEDPSQIVRLFEQNITARTKMILMCHIVNITGQIMPVADVVRMARTKGDPTKGGIPVVVDGAHALAHFEFKLPDLLCDYYAVSLHKWLAAPHGTGLLYVRKERIKALWPMMAAPDTLDDNIRKFEEIGTHPAAPYLAIGDALTFHQAIGDARKEARLRYLRDWWATRLLRNTKVRLHTSLKPQFSCGIGVFQVDGLDNGKLSSHLWDKHRILTTAIKHDEFEGIRVTPSVYTTLEELDRFCLAVEKVLKDGLPS